MTTAKHDCPFCRCGAEPPTYPVTCPECGVKYGPGGEVTTHRPGSDGCRNLAKYFASVKTAKAPK